MSSLRVPVFFGSILTLVVLVIQNRAPVYQLTLLGMRFRPLGLGFLVAIAVVSGLVLGALLQRMGPRRSPRIASRPSTPDSDVQTFGSIPQEPAYDEAFDFEEEEDRPDPEEDPEPKDPLTNTKGWDTSASSGWTEDASQESFWSRRTNARPRPERPLGQGSVTPFRPKEKREGSDPNAVVEAEYRIVTPYERQSDDGFDEDFFDDFFEEDQP